MLNANIEKNNNQEDNNIILKTIYEHKNKYLNDLKRNKLFKSSRLVEPVELKRIFLDVVGDGGVEGTPKRVVEVFDKLA